MTNTVAHRVQAWFTSRMPTTKSHRESTYEKAQRLIADDRFQVTSAARGNFWVGTCQGDHGRYAVFAIAPEYMAEHGIEGGRIGCTCFANATDKLCSHAIGAEELRLREQTKSDIALLSQAALTPWNGDGA